jgi:hypothetical protein
MISGTPNEVWILNVDVVRLLKENFSFFQVLMRFSAIFIFVKDSKVTGLELGKYLPIH